MTRRIVALSALSWALCALLYVAQPAHASESPDCTTQDKRDSTGIVRAGDEATITVTLTRDCTVSLWSYAQPGPRGALVDSAVASGQGTHTLSVRACAQVDFVPGPTHERGSGEAFSYERFDNDCEVPPSTTTQPSPTSTSIPPTSPTTTTTVESSPPTSFLPPTGASCVPQCENPDAPEHVPALAYGGPNPVTDAVALAFPFVLAAALGAWVVGDAMREDEA